MRFAQMLYLTFPSPPSSQAYKTLGVSKGATAAEVKAAHRKLIVTLHPDRVATLPDAEKVLLQPAAPAWDSESRV